MRNKKEVIKLLYELLTNEKCLLECYYDVGGDDGWFNDLKVVNSNKTWIELSKAYSLNNDDLYSLCDEYHPIYNASDGHYEGESGYCELSIEDSILYVTIIGQTHWNEQESKRFNLLEFLKNNNIEFDLSILENIKINVSSYTEFVDWIDQIDWINGNLPELVKNRYVDSLGALGQLLYPSIEDYIYNIYKTENEIQEDSHGFTLEFEAESLSSCSLELLWTESQSNPREGKQEILIED